MKGTTEIAETDAGALWRPLIEHSRRRHLKFRRRLAQSTEPLRAESVVSAGV